MNADFIRIQVPPCVGFGTEWVSKAVEVIKTACARVCVCVLDTRDGGLINMTDVFTVFLPQWNTTAVCVCVCVSSQLRASRDIPGTSINLLYTLRKAASDSLLLLLKASIWNNEGKKTQ